MNLAVLKTEIEEKAHAAIEASVHRNWVPFNRGIAFPICFIPEGMNFDKTPPEFERLWDFFMTNDWALQIPHVAEAVMEATQQIEDDVDNFLALIFEAPDVALMMYDVDQILRVVAVQSMLSEIKRLIDVFETGVITMPMYDLKTIVWLDFTIGHACRWGGVDGKLYEEFSTASLNIFIGIIEGKIDIIGDIDDFDRHLITLIETKFPEFLNLNND